MPKRNTCKRLSLSFSFFLFAFSLPSYGLETVSALDDGFALPSPATLAEASYAWPGSEAFAGEPFALLAWASPFGVRDLAVTTGVAGGRFGRAGIFLSCSGTDFDLYGDDQEKLGFSYLFTRALSIGGRITRNALRIEGFGSASAWSAEAGVVYRPVESLALAAAVEDLAGAELGECRAPIDGRSRLGVSWRIPETATLLVSAAKSRAFDPSISAGVIADITPSLLAGILGANSPDRNEFLAAVSRKGLRFSYRGAFHRDLGFTHGFSLGWQAAEIKG